MSPAECARLNRATADQMSAVLAMRFGAGWGACKRKGTCTITRSTPGSLGLEMFHGKTWTDALVSARAALAGSVPS